MSNNTAVSVFYFREYLYSFGECVVCDCRCMMQQGVRFSFLQVMCMFMLLWYLIVSLCQWNVKWHSIVVCKFHSVASLYFESAAVQHCANSVIYANCAVLCMSFGLWKIYQQSVWCGNKYDSLLVKFYLAFLPRGCWFGYVEGALSHLTPTVLRGWVLLNSAEPLVLVENCAS